MDFVKKIKKTFSFADLCRSSKNLCFILCLKLLKFFADFSSDGRLFQILGPRYERKFVLCFSFGKVDKVLKIFELFGSGQLVRTSLTCRLGLNYQDSYNSLIPIRALLFRFKQNLILLF